MTVATLALAAAAGLAAGRVGTAIADRFAPPRRRRMPLQELCTAAACTAAAVRFGATLALMPALVAAVSLVTLSAIDLRTYRLPDAVNVSALGASLLAIAAESMTAGRPGTVAVSLVAGGGYAAALWATHTLRPGALGLGDVKLAATLGVLLGWVAAAHHQPADAVALIAYALLAGCLLGLATALTAATLRRHGVRALPDPAQPQPSDNPNRLRDTAIPFGPALSSGTATAIMLSETLLH